MNKNEVSLFTQREATLKTWFHGWLNNQQLDSNFIENIFTQDITYIECWGPKYHNIREVKDWFMSWRKTNQVTSWDILRFDHLIDETIVIWNFECLKNVNQIDELKIKFDGVSLVNWTKNKIKYLHEYGAKIPEKTDGICFICESDYKK